MKNEQLEKLKRQCVDNVEKEFPGGDKVIVFGEGNTDTDIVLVGEAPGEKETLLARPFVGQAGKILDEFLEILKLNREDIYITNIVKFRPYKINAKTGRLSNRAPNKEEVKLCRPYLIKQLEIIKPKIVVTLGNISLRAIIDDDRITIGESHGTLMDMRSFFLLPLYHPASIIYNRKLKEIYQKDLVKLKCFIKDYINV
ncbi:uracil DNA glycosylase superfamily protein [Oxobacter pfennigii]|uniref:Type-4 uracil-DNA glycosylase n=1 Tax=Oxobacter pfennigii TaxID=36849 RepID=A0A0P8Y9X2_9CLOT|nr:uracil-DNA glycosylase [Oxobacter pfennigii]KPU43727.1 uracil DNA glycosylase superfamily protein [Oxobacter pfennigii]